MMNNAKIGAALVGGYLLGRTRKAKLAIGLGMFLAGRKLDPDPRAIGKLVTDSPVLGALSSQVRDEVLGAAKSAATGALTQRVNGFADSLHERALGMDRLPAADDADEAEGAGEDVRDQDSDGRAGASQDARRASGGSTALKRRSGAAGGARKSSTGSSGGGQAASKPRKAAAKPRTAGSTAGRSARGAGKTAARAASGKGGRNA